MKLIKSLICALLGHAYLRPEIVYEQRYNITTHTYYNTPVLVHMVCPRCSAIVKNR